MGLSNLNNMDMNDNHNMNHSMNNNDSSMQMGGHDMMMHGGHMMHMGNLKKKFWVSVILSLPIIFLSPAMGVHLPFQFSFPGSEWVVVIFATVLYFYGGEPFLSGAYYEIKDKSPK